MMNDVDMIMFYLGRHGDSGLWPITSTLVLTTTSWPPAWLRHSYTPPSSSDTQPSSSLATLSPSPPGPASAPAILWPFLYQAVTGVGLPVVKDHSIGLTWVASVTISWSGCLKLLNFAEALVLSPIEWCLPVAEQVRVMLPDTRAETWAGGNSLNLTNLSPA